MPRYIKPVPSAHLISPTGGEFLVSGTTETVEWTATDTDNSTISQVDPYYSVDGGNTYEHIVTTDDTGYYPWTVPEVLTDDAKLKVVATSSDFDQSIAVSKEIFSIAPAQQRDSIDLQPNV